MTDTPDDPVGTVRQCPIRGPIVRWHDESDDGYRWAGLIHRMRYTPAEVQHLPIIGAVPGSPAAQQNTQEAEDVDDRYRLGAALAVARCDHEIAQSQIAAIKAHYQRRCAKLTAARDRERASRQDWAADADAADHDLDALRRAVTKVLGVRASTVWAEWQRLSEDNPKPPPEPGKPPVDPGLLRAENRRHTGAPFDAAMAAWMRDRMGADPGTAAAAIADIRQFRADQDGRFTEEEAAAVGTTAEELNRQREEGGREIGDPTAPPAN